MPKFHLAYSSTAFISATVEIEADSLEAAQAEAEKHAAKRNPFNLVDAADDLLDANPDALAGYSIARGGPPLVSLSASLDDSGFELDEVCEPDE